MAKITASHNTVGLIRVFINETLHLAFFVGKISGIQSWEETTRSPPLYFIELTFDGGHIVQSDYPIKENWTGVLRAINEAFGEVR